MFEEIPAIRPNYDQPNYDEEKVAPYTLEASDICRRHEIDLTGAMA